VNRLNVDEGSFVGDDVGSPKSKSQVKKLNVDSGSFVGDDVGSPKSNVDGLNSNLGGNVFLHLRESTDFTLLLAVAAGGSA